SSTKPVRRYQAPNPIRGRTWLPNPWFDVEGVGAPGIELFVAEPLSRALAPHLAKPHGDVDPGSGASGVPIAGGRRRRALNAGKQAEDFVRQKARSRCEDVTTTMPVLLNSIKASRLHEMKVLSRTRHRHVEQPALLVDLLGVSGTGSRIIVKTFHQRLIPVAHEPDLPLPRGIRVAQMCDHAAKAGPEQGGGGRRRKPCECTGRKCLFR